MEKEDWQNFFGCPYHSNGTKSWLDLALPVNYGSGQVLMLPSWRLVHPAADDDFVRIQALHRKQLKTKASRWRKKDITPTVGHYLKNLKNR